MSDNPIRRLRKVGLWEGVSFVLLLFVAMPLKYVADQPMAVTIVGTIHGALFIGFLLALGPARKAAAWGLGQTAVPLVAALLPFGPFVIDRRLRGVEQELERSEES